MLADPNEMAIVYDFFDNKSIENYNLQPVFMRAHDVLLRDGILILKNYAYVKIQAPFSAENNKYSLVLHDALGCISITYGDSELGYFKYAEKEDIIVELEMKPKEESGYSPIRIHARPNMSFAGYELIKLG